MEYLKLVPLGKIPKGEPCDLDKLVELYRLGLFMEGFCEQEGGVGLAAVQLGVPLNFFIVKFPDSYRYFLNCSYTSLDDSKQRCVEGCLSIKARHFEVERFGKVLVEGKEIVLNKIFEIHNIRIEPQEIYSVIFQHEIDHANQITIDQIGKEVFLWE